MKKFVYLRINALVAIIAGIILLCYTLSAAFKGMQTHVFLFVTVTLIMLGLPIIHNLFIIFIYRRYYPGKEIGRFLSILNITLNIICIFDLVIYLYTTATFTTDSYRAADRVEAYMTFAVTALLCITTTIQIIGSFRLIKIVRENAMLGVEESFL